MRLFVAVYPPPAALDHLSAAVGRLRLGAAAAAGTNVRLTAIPLWHVTLVFLGEVRDDRGPDAVEAVRTGVAQWRELPAAGSALRLAGGGRFGRHRSTVLWVGLAGEVEPLRRLAQQLRRSLRRARLPYDRKPFQPHLTFARPGDRLPAAEVAADITTLAGYRGPSWSASEVHLVRSHLGPKPVHERLAAVPLT